MKKLRARYAFAKFMLETGFDAEYPDITRIERLIEQLDGGDAAYEQLKWLVDDEHIICGTEVQDDLLKWLKKIR